MNYVLVTDAFITSDRLGVLVILIPNEMVIFVFNKKFSRSISLSKYCKNYTLKVQKS